jgi:hypothetical protein
MRFFLRLDITGTWSKSPAKTISGIVFQQSELVPTIVDIGFGRSDGMDGTRLFKSFDCLLGDGCYFNFLFWGKIKEGIFV